MSPERVSNPGRLPLKSDVLLIALRRFLGRALIVNQIVSSCKSYSFIAEPCTKALLFAPQTLKCNSVFR